MLKKVPDSAIPDVGDASQGMKITMLVAVHTSVSIVDTIKPVSIDGEFCLDRLDEKFMPRRGKSCTVHTFEFDV